MSNGHPSRKLRGDDSAVADDPVGGNDLVCSNDPGGDNYDAGGGEALGRALREHAAEELSALVDSKFFKALCEPARVEIIRFLTRAGKCDVGTIAQNFPQDASVVSRHLRVLAEAGLLRREKRGRHVYFEIDGAAIVEQTENVLSRFRNLVPICCPGGEQ